MEQLLLNLDVGSPDPEDLAAIFRAAHSIKGGAATFGFSALTDTTHILESLLDRARNHELTLTRGNGRRVPGDQGRAVRPARRLPRERRTGRGRRRDDLREARTAEGRERRGCAGCRCAVAPVAAVAAPAAPAVEPAAGDDRVPDHVIEQAVAAAHPAGDAGEGGPHLKITLVGVDAKDRELLTEELGNLGRIVGREEVGADLTLWVESDVPSDDIVAVCCFVIDESQIRVGRGTAPAAPAAAQGRRGAGRGTGRRRATGARRGVRAAGRGTATGGIGTGRTRARRAGRRRASAASGPAGGACRPRAAGRRASRRQARPRRPPPRHRAPKAARSASVSRRSTS